MSQFSFPQDICEQIWKQKYQFNTDREDFHSDTDVVDTWSRIANSCANIPRLHNNEEERQALEQRFFNALSDFKMLPAGRIQSGAGTARNVTLFNCFVMGTIPDSLDGIFDMLKEAALTMQQGGGIGYDFSTLRPKGAPVKGVESFSSGPLTFMDVWDAMCKTIMSAGSRRGAMMATMRCDHPDIMEFITAKQDPLRLRNFNVSVLVTDAFMEAVAVGADWNLRFGDRIYETIHAPDLWNAILKNTYDFAEPGVIFIDRINRENNLHFLETIAATNPCLHPDTLIETVEGRIRIADINKPIKVYTSLPDGSLGVAQATASWVSKKDAKVWKILTRNGKEIKTTPDHKVLTHEHGWVETKDLKLGDHIVQLCRARRGAEYSGVKLTTEDNRAYRMEHRMIAESVFGDLGDNVVHHLNNDTYDNHIDNFEMMTAEEHNKLTASTTHPQNHQVHSDYSGQFVSTGKSPKRITPMPDHLKSHMKNNYSNAVVEIIEEFEVTDVYDLTVEGTHNMIGNFMVVHNCGEQPLPPYGACLLGSVNLAKFVVNPFCSAAYINEQLLEETVRTGTRLLDSVIDTSGFPLEQQKEEALNKRRQGLGVTGLADLLFMLGYRYGSQEAVEITDSLMHKIAVWAYEESILMAKEIGPAPCLETKEARMKLVESGFMKRMPNHIRKDAVMYGLRNALLLSIAPTGTISMYAGNVSSGIEPIFAPFYDRKITRDSGVKETERVSVYSVHEYFKAGFSQDDEWWVKYMATAQDLTPQAHIVMQAAAQKWIDSSISKTVNVPEDIPFEEFKEVYMQAYNMGCKGCTTYRPNEVTGSVLSVVEETETKDKNPEKKPSTNTDMRIITRGEIMDGSTYKLRWSGDAYYVTINHALMDEGWYAPAEVFVNTKNPEHIAWTGALTRMISAIFQRGGDIRFVAEELQSVFDPKGGQWVQGHYVPSLVALIGKTIQEHLMLIGYQITPKTSIDVQQAGTITPEEQSPGQVIPDQCPSCKGFNTIKVSGCPVCQDCGHSKCG